MYTNFTLLWSPLQTLVAGYGNSVKRDTFWNVFGARLAAADKDIQSFLTRIRDGKEIKETENKKRVDFIKVFTGEYELQPPLPFPQCVVLY